MKKILNKWSFLIAITFFSSALYAAESIKVGMSAALTGSASALGRDMKTGIESYFAIINEQGGVGGRLLEFIVKDDGYEPKRAAENMRALIEQDKVLAVIGNIGTPTAIVTVPIAQQSKMLLFGAFSGAEVLRPKPADRYIINYRASYAEETEEIINGLLLAGIKPQEIAFFTQNDGYGNAIYQGSINVLHDAQYQATAQLAHGQYTRNTLNVESAVAIMLDAAIEPKVIIMAAGYKASAKFISLLKQDIPEMLFINLSFVGSHALREELSTSDRVIITEVVPNLFSAEPIVKEYLEAMERFDSTLQTNTVSLEGFIVAKLFHQGLLNIENEITTESIIDGIEALRNVDIGLGENVYYDEHDHQAMHKLWVTCLCDGTFKPFDWEKLITRSDW